MNWRRVLRDTLIVWFATAVGGVVVGFGFGILGAGQSPKLAIAIAFSNLVLGTIAFAVVGALTRTRRFRHLVIVALSTWVTSLANVALFGVTLVQWAGSLLLLVVVMLIGGGLSWLLVRPSKSGESGETA